jgi:hypothetical protein
MKAIRQLGLLMPLTLLACATAVTQDLSEPEDEGQGATGGTDSVIPTGGKSNEGGKASAGSTSSTSGTGPKAFGGTSTSGGTGSGEGGEGSGGDAGSTSSAGKTSGGSGGSGGSATGGTGGSSAGSGGKASGGSGGSPVGPGDCSGTPLFMAGANTKYALNAKVVATCAGGTPCTQAQPPLQQGKAYEFNCIDQYNCGVVDPATTNWAIPPWTVVKACE